MKEKELRELLSHNPDVDAEQLEEWRELLQRLRASGVRRKEYDLSPHSGKHRATFQDRTYSDLRLATGRARRGRG